MHHPRVEAYISMVAGWSIRQTAQRDVAEALSGIQREAMIEFKQALRVLALRRYLRLQERDRIDLHSIWPWSEEQVQESLRDGAARDLMNEAGRVQVTFARSNPGYTLGLSPPRSLASQVHAWVISASAQVAGRRLLREAARELADSKYELPPPVTKVAAFAVWLRERRIDPEPGNAAPGTSDHGQMRAVDFVVMRGREVVAGGHGREEAGRRHHPPAALARGGNGVARARRLAVLRDACV